MARGTNNNGPFETCGHCKGSGLEDGFYGPRDCSVCYGNCVVMKRDNKGRFTKSE
jgi:DnaJ-class molecular chaperone